MHFSWIFFGNFRVYRYIKVSFVRVSKYLNKRLRRIGERNGKSFKGVSNTKNKKRKPKRNKKKKHMKRFSFITQFKIEFLLLFTDYRKVLGKMSDSCVYFCVRYHRSR